MADQGTDLKEGMILQNIVIRPSDKVEGDALAFHGRMAIVLKGVALRKDQKRRVNIVIEEIKGSYAFAKLI